jgi:type VI secretion system protein ImpC
VRSPRVHITYDVEIGDAIEQRELPLVVAILSNLSGSPEKELPPIKKREFVDIDRDNFNEVMAGCMVRESITVKNMLKAPVKDTSIILKFSNIDSFSPLSLVLQMDLTKELYQVRSNLRDFTAKLDGNDPLDKLMTELLSKKELQTELSTAFKDKKPEEFKDIAATGFLEKLIDEMARDKAQRPYAMQLLGQFTVDLLPVTPPAEGEEPASAAQITVDKIANIDKQLTLQINEVLHNDKFKKLESTWRGLHFLVMNTETSTKLKLRLFNVSKQDLLRDLQKAVEFDQSALFKKVYEEEFGTYGGDPFSFMVGDYEFGRLPAEIDLLEKISGVAASAHAPFITAADNQLFDMKNFFSLGEPRDLSKIFESAELMKWRGFRGSEDSRYVTLTLPKVLLRLPYGKETTVVEGFDFEEDVDGKDASKYLWGNSAYVLAQRITNAFAKYGWLAAIRGVEGGGLVEGLPTHTFKTPSGDVKTTCPTQVTITDRREKELNDLGFMAILHRKGSDKAAFFGGQTTNLPKKYNTDAANANARISSMLPYVLNASRFAHYIKVIMRDKVGSFLTKDNAQTYLNNWIANYVLVDDAAPQEMKASYPLRDARINVTDVPGSPGKYRAVVFLRPHFQLEELSTSIRLVAELP